MEKPKHHVLIATPTPGTVKTAFMKVVIATMRDLAAQGIGSDFETREGSDIVALRNALATHFLDGTSATHLFFADSDMAFPASLCARMVSIDKPVLGAIYPARGLNLEAAEAAVKRGLSFQAALLSALHWHAYGALDEGSGPLRKVTAVPFGAVLIKREVLVRMADGRVATELPREKPSDPRRLNFFGAPAGFVAQGAHFAEDLAFCHRWRQGCDGEVWAVLDAPIAHIGDFGYGGASFIDALRARAQQKAPA